MKIDIIIPTWKRHELLSLALNSLIKQTRKPDQVIVVYRQEDNESLNTIKKFKNVLNINEILVEEPGVIYAENKGINAASGDIIVFLDDDAEVKNNWLQLIENNFNDNKNIVGVGGPDFITGHHDPNYRKIIETIGKITFFGKIIGNHHHISKSKLYVDVLKGVNMAFKASVINLLDPKLQSLHNQGNGSHWELDLCLQATKYGKLLFDPALDLLHHSNHTHFIHHLNLQNNSRNLSYVILKNFNIFRKIFFILYITIIGNSQIIGFGKYIQLCVQNGVKLATSDYYYSTKGLIRGVQLFIFK